MADDVQRELERMIPELEDLEDRCLFSSDEIKMIVDKRRNFEYLMKRKAPRKEDYLRYIEYETALESLRQKRKERKGVKKPGIADFAGQRRIHFIFERALRKFRDDFELWGSAIKYAQSVSAHTVIAKRLGEAVKLHPRHIDFWIMSASIHFEMRGDVTSARSALQQGLRVNKKDIRLWSEYIKFEALFVLQILKRREVLGIAECENTEKDDSPEDIAREAVLKDGKLLRIAYENAIREMPKSAALRCKIAEVMEPLFDTLVGDMAKKLCVHIWNESTNAENSSIENIELCWEGRALFEYRHGEDQSVSPRQRALVVFQEALKRKRTPYLIELYVTFLTQTEEEVDAVVPSKRRKSTRNDAPPSSNEVLLCGLLEDIDGDLLSGNVVSTLLSSDCATPKIIGTLSKMYPYDCGIILKSMESVNASKDLKVVLKQLLVRDPSEWTNANVETVSALFLTYLEKCVADETNSTKYVIDEFFWIMKTLYYLYTLASRDAIVDRVIDTFISWLISSGDANFVDKYVAKLQANGIPPSLPLSAHLALIRFRIKQYEKLPEFNKKVSKMLHNLCLSNPESVEVWVEYVLFEKQHGSLKSEQKAILCAMQSATNKEQVMKALSSSS